MSMPPARTPNTPNSSRATGSPRSRRLLFPARHRRPKCMRHPHQHLRPRQADADRRCRATIGSCNLHNDSLYGHSEMNAIFYVPENVRALRVQLLAEHFATEQPIWTTAPPWTCIAASPTRTGKRRCGGFRVAGAGVQPGPGGVWAIAVTPSLPAHPLAPAPGTAARSHARKSAGRLASAASSVASNGIHRPISIATVSACAMRTPFLRGFCSSRFANQNRCAANQRGSGTSSRSGKPSSAKTISLNRGASTIHCSVRYVANSVASSNGTVFLLLVPVLISVAKYPGSRNSPPPAPHRKQSVGAHNRARIPRARPIQPPKNPRDSR